ncbi:MAG: cytochrome c [Proteobacteria bacterium]|nr:cytochrome c [Pseudomonadota bacterium]
MRRLVACSVCVAAIGLAAIAVANTPPRTPAILALGKATYEGSAVGCIACHGLTGEGNGPVAFSLKPPPRDFTRDPFKAGESVEQVFATITNGLPNTPMAPFAKITTDDQRWALAYYVLSFRPHK